MLRKKKISAYNDGKGSPAHHFAPHIHHQTRENSSHSVLATKLPFFTTTTEEAAIRDQLVPVRQIPMTRANRFRALNQINYTGETCQQTVSDHSHFRTVPHRRFSLYRPVGYRRSLRASNL